MGWGPLEADWVANEHVKHYYGVLWESPSEKRRARSRLELREKLGCVQSQRPLGSFESRSALGESQARVRRPGSIPPRRSVIALPPRGTWSWVTLTKATEKTVVCELFADPTLSKWSDQSFDLEQGSVCLLVKFLWELVETVQITLQGLAGILNFLNDSLLNMCTIDMYALGIQYSQSACWSQID